MRYTLPVCFFVLVAALPSQGLRDERKQHLPDLPFDRPLLLDADRDGDLDAVIGGDQIRLLLNLGRLRFADVSAQTMPQLSGTARATADLDGDGDLDLFTSGPELLLNDRGSFTLASVGRIPVLNNPVNGFALGDVDGDGDVDAFVGGQPQSWILRNNGAAVFTAVTLHPAATAAAGAWLFDVDGDRDRDLLVANDRSTTILTNDGTGQFTPLASALPTLGFVDVAVADVDRDGDQDFAAGYALFPFATRRLFLNDGSGRFVDSTTTHLPPTQAGTTLAIVAQDIDADGDVDLLFGRNDLDSELLLNDGTGHFSVGDAGDLRTLPTPLPAAGDLDGNGTIDLLTAPAHVLVGRRAGAFVLVDGAAIEPDAVTVIAIADFTGDGDLDLLQTHRSLSNYIVKRNDGTGTFRPSHYTPQLAWQSNFTTAVGDIDGDGDVDVVRSALESLPSARALSVLRNDGSGSFATPTRTLLPSNGGLLALYVADVDGDGDADVIDIGSNGVLVLANDGRGNFTTNANIRLPYVLAADCFDYDGDGDRDLFLSTGRLTLLENQQGTFVDVTAQRFTTVPSAQLPRLATVYGRTWLFLSVGSQLLVYEGGSSGFTPRPDLTYSASPGQVTRIVPSGGSLLTVDLIARQGASVRILRFNPPQGFFDVTTAVLGGANYTDVQPAGDLDGDGDMDWLGDRSQFDKRVLRGTQRTMLAPFAAILGQDFEYRVSDATATTANPLLLNLVLGTALIRFPVPGLGILRVDPATAIVLPPITVRSSRPLSITFRVPANIVLRDVSLVAQPFLVYPLRGISSLGAAVREVIR